MRTLFHLWLDPACRKIRLILGEKDLDFQMKVEKIWERREDFLALSPSGELPVLIEDDGIVLPDHQVIAAYLEEAYPEPTLLDSPDPAARAEVRRLSNWFDAKFRREVTDNLVEEKVMKRFLGLGAPDSQAIRAGKANIGYHLDYIGWLSERRRWMAGDNFSQADIAAAAQLSCLDYLGDVPWEKHEAAKDWYARVKSRPSFRPLLADRSPGINPPAHYADLDF